MWVQIGIFERVILNGEAREEPVFILRWHKHHFSEIHRGGSSTQHWILEANTGFNFES